MKNNEYISILLQLAPNSKATPNQHDGRAATPGAFVIPTGIGLYILSLLTLVGNAMVLHAIRTEKRLQTVGPHSILDCTKTIFTALKNYLISCLGHKMHIDNRIV